jgi:GNAT superfamily N-acetyltransferase
MTEPLMIRGRPPRSTAVALLQVHGLPVSDITDEHLEHFFFVGSDSSPTGLVGLELHGAAALLRSLVVAEHARSKGLGSALIDHAEEYAAGAPIERTREFAGLCPTSSAFMSKRI